MKPANVVSYSRDEIVAKSTTDFSRELRERLSHLLQGLEIKLLQDQAWVVTARWLHQIASALPQAFGHTRFILEYKLPLSTDRPDVVAVTGNAIFVIEAKTGEKENLGAARSQTLRYARGFYNFINIATDRAVVPVLLRNKCKEKPGEFCTTNPPSVASIFEVTPSRLAELIAESDAPQNYEVTDPAQWLYKPRPDIVDAARLLFANNDVDEIMEGLADDEELQRLIGTCERLASEAKSKSLHYVVAISGVPGAGKTLVGLRLSNSPTIHELCEGDHTSTPMYLSGNGPLVDVLTEALTRDGIKNQGLKKEDAKDAAIAKIRLVHGLTSDKFVVDTHVVVFDEAQRAWTKEHMARKLQRDDLGSECEEVLRRMESQTWSIVFCLVGTGQEINSGERGLETWLDAVKSMNERANSPKWTLFVNENPTVQPDNPVESVKVDDALHLKVVRRAENASLLAEWVEHVLAGNSAEAAKSRSQFEDFPLFVTRDLSRARVWLKESQDARAERAGLVASSESARLSVYGVDVPASASDSFNWPEWFLDPPPNLNSSMKLEVAATEYKCQGLELDRVGVCWSWDFVRDGSAWDTRKIRRSHGSWGRNNARKKFAVAAYRVLLTRARKGMVIWVPQGDPNDPSRRPEEMDEVNQFLLASGATPLSAD